MDSEKTLLDWIDWPLLLVILVTPLRFALEAAGVSAHITRYFSSTVFVFILAAYLGTAMANEITRPVRTLLATAFSLGYLNGLMTLIATVLSTYASIETHYRHHSMNMSDAQHVLMEHVIRLPILISVIALVVAGLFFVVSLKIKQLRKGAH